MPGPLKTENLADADAPRGAPTPVVLEVVDGTARGKRLRLTAGTVHVGSGEECQLVLPDRGTSRQHASIELLHSEVRVTDLGSRNGTFYLGARLEQARVPVGATLRFGLSLVRVLPELADEPVSDKQQLHSLVGRSLEMRRLFALIEQVAPSDATVLIRGETGTGKDGVARALHASSKRAAGPLIVFDCASVTENLVESHLFGHVKGAFTGAEANKAGSVEEAEGGTLFLDEVGELPAPLQAKFLRLLESREYTRVGEVKPRRADVRVIAATHRDLEQAVADAKFRRDLYFRLAVVVLDVPPLRNRREDIPLLVDSFAQKLTGRPLALSSSTLASLTASEWPGNVRELRNVVERAVALGREPVPAGVSAPRAAAAPVVATAEAAGFRQAREALIARFERDYLEQLLARHQGNVSAAAREADLSRSQFYRLLQRHGLAVDRPE